MHYNHKRGSHAEQKRFRQAIWLAQSKKKGLIFLGPQEYRSDVYQAIGIALEKGMKVIAVDDRLEALEWCRKCFPEIVPLEKDVDKFDWQLFLILDNPKEWSIINNLGGGKREIQRTIELLHLGFDEILLYINNRGGTWFQVQSQFVIGDLKHLGGANYLVLIRGLKHIIKERVETKNQDNSWRQRKQQLCPECKKSGNRPRITKTPAYKCWNCGHTWN